MSIRLLIADDEAIECRALTMQLRKAFPAVTLLEPVHNGIELLKAAREQRPEIVIADIEMPGMNGLQALEQLQAENLRPHIIIMTAYSSEHYLKESISLRVFEYLEKPIRRERVLQAAAAVIAEIEAERAQAGELARMRDMLKSLREVICSELMLSIEAETGDAQQAVQYLEMLELNGQGFSAMTLSVEPPARQEAARLSGSVYELWAFEGLRARLKDRSWICGHVMNHRMSCLVPIPQALQSDADYRLRQWACCEADAVLQMMENLRGLRIGIGSGTFRPDGLRRSRQESVQALYRQDGNAAICHYEDQPLQSGAGNPFEAEELMLAEAVRSGNAAQADALIRTGFAAIPGWMGLGPLRNAVFDTLMQLKRSCRPAVNENWPMEVSERLNRCEGQAALEQCFGQICHECIEQGHETDKRWQEDIIARARQFIDAHYSTDLSLELVAEAVGVSRFYLSRLFKLRLGMNYSTYLTEQRIRIAAALIQQQKKLSNSEIAVRVGFRDADYFGKVFKKLIGCTVSEYREKQC